MGISAARLIKHVEKWESQLGGSNRPYRSYWPSHLFHHSPIENAIEILNSGQLLSRNGSASCRRLDVAHPEVISSKTTAHDFCRFYFRPKTPTQYHIEGVRRLDEFYAPNCHAPILIMMVFSSKSLLTQQGVHFSIGNMQHSDTMPLSGDDQFDQINFAHVYHDSSFDAVDRDAIIFSRCAEVLVPSPLPLAESLEAILCRSSAERATLVHSLQPNIYSELKEKIRTVTEIGIFFGNHAYVESVELTAEGARVKFHPRRDGHTTKVSMAIRKLQSLITGNWTDLDLDLTKTWNFPFSMEAGRYSVRIELEGCLAYNNILVIDSDPF